MFLSYRRHLVPKILLMPDLVMTADHCVSHGKAIQVIAGAHDITTEETSQQIIRVTKRRYVRLGKDDVALIKVKI
uniref:Peptidase S1 domain-containing protein n=1 Tax=Panagrolaimus davidi TaxID=227884 RepID=A0A914R0R8_9BILA